MKRATVSKTPKTKAGQESLQTADENCKGENKENDRNTDSTNRTTESEKHLQATGKLTLGDISEVQSSNRISRSSNNKNTTTFTTTTTNNNNNNGAKLKLYTFENRTKGKRLKTEENKGNKEPTENSAESKSKLRHNFNPEESSEGQTNNETGSITIECKGKRKTKGKKSTMEEPTENSTENKSKLKHNSNPEDTSQGHTNNKNCSIYVACNVTGKTKGKRSKKEETDSNKDKTGNTSGSRNNLKLTDKSNPEDSSKGLMDNRTGAIPQQCAKHKRKGKRSIIEGSTRDSTVNKNDNTSDRQDLLEYFKAVESVNEGFEQRHKENSKSDRREDSSNGKNTERSTESKSELKAKGKPSPEHSSEGQRTNITGARPKVLSAGRNGVKGKKRKGEVRKENNTVNENENKNDENDLLEYFKAVESVNEGIVEFRPTEHGTSKRGCRVSSSPDQGGDELKTNKQDKKSTKETAAKDTPDNFVKFIKTIAYQMIGNIERRIEEAKIMIEKENFRMTRRKALEAMAGAQEAKDQLLLFKNEFIQESNLADWFGTCAFILDKSLDFLAAAKCFYTAIVFDSEWTEQKHHAVSSELWDKIYLTVLDQECFKPKFRSSLSPSTHFSNQSSEMCHDIQDVMDTNLNEVGVVHLLLEMEKLTQLAESRCRWKVCINICHDALNWEKFLDKEHGIFVANPLNKVRRLALSHFHLGEYKAAQTYCLSILNDLTEFDDLAAFEIWARSLFLLGKYDVALPKVELGLWYAKTPEDTERLRSLRSEIQSSITEPQKNSEPDSDLLSGTLLKSQPSLEQSISVSNLSKRKPEIAKRRSRHSKANGISKLESVSSSPTDSAVSSGATIPNSIQNTATASYLKKKKQVPIVTAFNEPQTESLKSNHLKHEGMSTDDSESDEIGNSEILLSTSEPEEEIIGHIDDEPSFYDKTRYKFSGQKRSNFTDINKDVADEKLMTSGVILNLSYMQRFREKAGTPFYKSFLPESELLQRLRCNPNIYKRCILQIDGSHVSYCYPIDCKNSGIVIEISGRSKAGQTYNEDEVVVELLDKVHRNRDRRYGRVVGIINRQRFKDVKHPVFLCTLDDMDSHLVRPLCKTVPKINILHRQISNKYPNQARYKVEIYTYDHISQTLSDGPEFASINPGERETYLFLVALIRWSPNSIYPQGAVIRMLTCGSTVPRGLAVLDLKHKVPALYNRHTYECVEGILASYRGEESLINEFSAREDLRDIHTFTIDPPGSQDLDDALSIEKIEDSFRVGVHIADVSALVSKNDPIDLEAYERTVTYYPTIRRPRNMLPEPLSSNLCSLLPNRQRRTISVFFLLDGDGTLSQSWRREVKVVRSVIKSRQSFTYKEVQDIIDNPETNHHPLKSDIIKLFELAKEIRQRRLGDAMFALDIENDEVISEDSHMETFEAHFLVEEFMIMANQKVAEILTERFPSCTPIRSQPPPSRENMESFFGKYSDFVDVLVKLQGKKYGNGKRIDVEKIREFQSTKCIMVSKSLWETFKSEPGKAMQCLKIDDLYPIQHIVHQHWIGIQERAEYQCSDGTTDVKQTKHFSLDMYPYTHFTSPIRRYNDLVVQRLLIAALEGTRSPYSKTEIEQMCVHMNSALKRAKEYQRSCRTLEHAIKLKSNPQMIYCFVDEVTDRNVTLCAPEMKYMDKQSRQLAFNLLDMRHKPKLIQDITATHDKVEASWRKRIYNTSGVSTAPSGSGILQTLDPNPGFLAVPLHTWARMLTCVLENRQTDLKRTMDMASVYSSEKGVDDVSTESINSMDIQPYTDFSLTFSHGQSLKGQISCAPLKGCLSPQLTLYNMTNNVKLCMQHTENPVLHLCRYSTKPTLSKYDSAKAYINRWLPIMMMEAATEAVANEECFIINNVAIKFESEREGIFSLSLAYCELRNLDFSGMDDEEEKSDERRVYDWLCLKFTSTVQNQTSNESNKLDIPKLKTVWVGHAEISKVLRKKLKVHGKDGADDGKLTFSFHLHKKCPSVLQEARQKKSKFSVEVLRKSEVDRRTEKYIKKLEEAKPDSVSMKIALNIGKMPALDPGHANLADIIERDFVVGSGDNVFLPENNTKQQEAIDKALTERFSLIQGPPGTGKSYTGIKLMCLFDKINSIKHKEGGKRYQVLFCGPSNKSVDLVARWMLRRLGNKMPKFLRVYGRTIEAMDFPVPGRTFQSRKSVHNLQADEQLRSVSLHHLIRVKGETNAGEITAMDKMFKANNYAPDPANVKKYVHLIREASIEMIRKYDVILCTTAVGSNPKVLEAANIFQEAHISHKFGSGDNCLAFDKAHASAIAYSAAADLIAGVCIPVIIDEAGMCPEPQCLVPILATGAEQVVLIGDHKQLRPIIKCKEAALLGLNKSLFERYSDNERIPLTMLELQYRMHPEICRFPSKTFYNGRLITKPGLWKGEIIDIWPTSEGRQRPHVLVHVEGEEKALTVSTDEGNEQSKSNQEEIDIVVNVYKYLIQDQSLSAGQINVMSQYNAQVTEIKRRLHDENLLNFIVTTVVSSQGGEWDYVIFSTVRSLPMYKIEEKPTRGWCQQNLGFITDQNQINVALTRARKGIIIIGNMNLLRCDEVWKELITDYERKGCIKTPDDFPPPKTSRLEMMERQYQRTWDRYGDSIFQRGTATSYDGPIDDVDDEPLNRTRRSRVRNRDRY